LPGYEGRPRPCCGTPLSNSEAPALPPVAGRLYLPAQCSVPWRPKSAQPSPSLHAIRFSSRACTQILYSPERRGRLACRSLPGRNGGRSLPKGAGRIRTDDGGFAIRCLSLLATAPKSLPQRNLAQSAAAVKPAPVALAARASGGSSAGQGLPVPRGACPYATLPARANPPGRCTWPRWRLHAGASVTFGVIGCNIISA
jgi:hypothetical protein